MKKVLVSFVCLNLILSSTAIAKTEDIDIVINVNNSRFANLQKESIDDEFIRILDNLTQDDFVKVYEQVIDDNYYSSLTKQEKDNFAVAKLVENYNHVNNEMISTYGVSRYLPDSYARLNEEEKKLVRLNPSEALAVYAASKDATNETLRRFKRNGEDDVSDAFRHAFWNAHMTTIFYVDQITGNGSRPSTAIASRIAEKWATAHEQGATGLPRTMDLYNNNLGRSIAVSNLPVKYDILSNKVYNSIETGKGKMIVNNKLVATKL